MSEVRRLSGLLCSAEIASKQALQIVHTSRDRFQEGHILLFLGLVFTCIGKDFESEMVLRRALAIFVKQPNKMGEGLLNAYMAFRSLNIGQPQAALHFAQRAWELAHVDRGERDFVRAARIQGEVAMACNDLNTALNRLQYALGLATKVEFTEEEIPVQIALGEWHRLSREFDEARELLNQIWDAAERGPYPLFHADGLNVLAQIERDHGNRDAAIAAATKAYALAWCDGISADGKVCYAYHYGLTNARKHLQELGAPEPQLRPFDASKFEPMPEVELNPKDEFWVNPEELDSKS